jgi:hypothetical protein
MGTGHSALLLVPLRNGQFFQTRNVSNPKGIRFWRLRLRVKGREKIVVDMSCQLWYNGVNREIGLLTNETIQKGGFLDVS